MTQLPLPFCEDYNDQSMSDYIQDMPLELRFGILPPQKIREYIGNNYISVDQGTRIEPHQIQPASLDLRLGSPAIEVDAGFLPGKNYSVPHFVASSGLE